MSGGCVWQGACVAGWGTCMAKGDGGTGAAGGHAWLGGGGLCVAAETATAAGGTQPTGMHSCNYKPLFRLLDQ